MEEEKEFLEIKTLNQSVFYSTENGEKTLVEKIAYEPFIRNRFIVRFPSEMGVHSWFVKSITMPSLQIDIEGKDIWDDITVKFRSFIGPSTPQAIMENLKPAKDFEMNIEFLDPSQVTVQKWNIEVEKTLSIDFGGTASYEADGIQEIVVILRPKNCILHF